MSRVSIGTCAGPADAALVRAMFAAHDIPVVISGEQHAGMLGGLGGSFLRLDILVDEADAEEASALLQDLRSGQADPADDEATPAGDTDGDDAHDDRADDRTTVDADGLSVEARVERRRRTGVALLLSLCISFGTGHMFAGAWLRGVALAALEALAIALMAERQPVGIALFVGAILADAIGSVSRVRRRPRPTIPRARVAAR